MDLSPREISLTTKLSEVENENNRLRAALKEIYEMMFDDRCGDIGDIKEIASKALKQ